MNDLMFEFKRANNLYKLLIINAAVYLVVLLLSIFGFFFGFNLDDFIIGFFALPASLKKLLFHFWTPVSYMFLHIDFWHIFGNMLWLFFMGQLFVMHINDKALWRVYFLGGLSGALLYLISFNVFPVFAPVREVSYLFGASAAVSAVVIAIIVYQPLQEVFLFGIFRIKLFWIGIFYVVYDLASITGPNSGGHLAHLGGAIYGAVFALQLQKGKDITLWLQNLFAAGKKTSKRKRKFTVHDFRTRDDWEYNKTKHEIQEELDRILEKISKKGYDSLTKKEKDFLRKYKDYFS